MQRLASRGAAAAVAGVASLSAAPAESRRAPELAPDALEAAASALKDEMKSQGLLVSVSAEDGSEWLDVPSAEALAADAALEELVDLAAAVASDAGVQRVILEKSREQRAFHEAVDRLLDRQGAAGAHASLSSFETVGSFDAAACAEVGSSPSSLLGATPTPSEMDAADGAAEAAATREENSRLRRENAALKDELRGQFAADELAQRPAVARLQALARGVLTRHGFYAAFEPPPPRAVAASLSAAAAVAAGEGGPLVRLRLRAVAPQPPKRRTADATHQAAVVTAAILLGLLALAIGRNPSGARAAAASAAATVAALLSARRSGRGAACV